MNKTDRAELVRLLVNSICKSVATYQAVEETGHPPMTGYNIGNEDTKTSIKRRCMTARAELMTLIKELED